MSFRDVLHVLLVAVGGALGAVTRHLVSLLCNEMFHGRFPWGTLIVNVVGCFLLGWLLQSASISATISDATRLAIGTGFLGAFTTFSTFSVETINAWNRSPSIATVYVMTSVIVGLFASLAGIYVATRLSGTQG